LMVPSLEPVPVAIGVVGAGSADEAAAPAGAAGLLAWAQAEVMERTAMARTERRNLLVIGSLDSLEHCSGKYGFGKYGFRMNSEDPRQAMLCRTRKGLRLAFLQMAAVRPSSDKAHWIAGVTRRSCGRVVHPGSSICNGVDRNNYRYHRLAASNCIPRSTP
jgi:hypothetical protein